MGKSDTAWKYIIEVNVFVMKRQLRSFEAAFQRRQSFGLPLLKLNKHRISHLKRAGKTNDSLTFVRRASHETFCDISHDSEWLGGQKFTAAKFKMSGSHAEFK